MTLGLAIMFGLTVASTIATLFNIAAYNAWTMKWVKWTSIGINVILVALTAVFWIALADGISREAYICKHYATKYINI